MSDLHEMAECHRNQDGEEFEEIYVCRVCGHEDHPDCFGRYCPECLADLDELEGELEQ